MPLAISRACLALPSPRCKASFIAAVREYIAVDDEPNWHPDMLRDSFDEYLETLRAAEIDPLPGYVPATTYWLITPDNRYIGDLSLRHHLNDNLRRFGGHIGYRIRPSCRRKGYGKLICALGIKRARLGHGIGDILITCDDDNIASIKIIEANAGQLQDRIDNQRGVLTRRYWIRGD